MKKKFLSLTVAIGLLATAAIGGTLAYFTDTEQATNTMTIGDVQINIDEFQKNEDGEWEAFENKDFTLYPVDSSVGINYRNKVAYTANVSKSYNDAYIRTIVLFEANENLGDDYVGQANCCVPGLHFNYYNRNTATSVINDKTIHPTKATVDNLKVKIADKEYWVVVFEDANKEAVPYDQAQISLNGVFMDKNITQDLAKGWGDDGVDIIVFSQAIQAEGLNYAEAMEALGDINETSLQSWLTGEDKANDATLNDWGNSTDPTA